MTVSLDGVEYRYRRQNTPALRDVTVAIEPGRTILLGPNGAGKSTLIAILAGASTPTSGTLTMTSDGSRATVGWMPQDIRPLRGFTVVEQVAYVGWLQGMPKRQSHMAALKALTRVRLEDRPDVKSSALSGGQLRRLGLAQALVHDPTLLLLDEPTAGLDIAQRENFTEILNGISTTIDHTLVATHDVADLTTSFDSVCVLATGKVKFHGSVDEFIGDVAATSTKAAVLSAYERAVGGPAV